MKKMIFSLLIMVLLISCNKKNNPEPSSELYEGYTKDLELANKIIGKKWKLQNEEVYVELSSDINEELSKKFNYISGKSIYTSSNPEIIDEGNFGIYKYKETNENTKKLYGKDYYESQEKGEILGNCGFNASHGGVILELTENTLIIQEGTEFLKNTTNGKEYWEVVK